MYLVGGSIDRLFFADALPTPTFGTGGILWAALTLALLTVPVVIVATEEGLAAVPRGVREGRSPSGATKIETIVKVVLPAAAPGILTGMILAMARAAGEVAPLMIVGMVKLAPALPVDGTAPFVHLERKFMHLGFHIYDVGFQSPNVEATKPVGLRDRAASDRGRHRRESRGDHAPEQAAPEVRRRARCDREPHPDGGRICSLWYGKARALHGITLQDPGEEDHRVHRPVGLRQVDAAALLQPDERPRRRRAHEGTILFEDRSIHDPQPGRQRPCAAGSGWSSRNRTRSPSRSTRTSPSAAGSRASTGSATSTRSSSGACAAPRSGTRRRTVSHESALGLSGGQQQRLCIARAHRRRARGHPARRAVLGARSDRDGAKVEELMLDLKSRYTLVIVTHNMQQATRVSDYTAFLYLGTHGRVRRDPEAVHQPGEEADRGLHHGPLRLGGEESWRSCSGTSRISWTSCRRRSS